MLGQKVLISANLILTSRRHTWLVLQNILKRSIVSLNLASYWSPLIAYLAAEATRLERALTQPLETDDLDDLSLEPDNIVPEERSIPQPSATSAPKKKQSAKRKSPSKTTEGMSRYSQYFVSWLNTRLAVQRTSTTSSKASATVSNASTVVPTTSILTHVPGPGVSNTTANLTTTNATTSSDDSAMVPNASTIVPTASIVTHITDPGATNTTNNTITTNAEATSISWEQFAGK